MNGTSINDQPKPDLRDMALGLGQIDEPAGVIFSNTYAILIHCHH